MAGIYLHIPYCKKACNYCDFHFSTSQGSRPELIGAMLSELEQRKDYLGNQTIETIYFGGGTPSMLSEYELSSLLDKIFSLFTIAANAEITLEANPDDLDPAKTLMLQRSAVNRLSIGIQSFYEEDLRWMNRAHTAVEAENSIRDVQSAGFENLSIDLIYGYPLLTDAKWAANISKAASLGIQHLSCYSMTVEPATALDLFVKKGKTPAMDEEQSARQFEYLVHKVPEFGIFPYEISNFSIPGFHSRHNSNYWNGIDYLGIGPSAHSFNQVSRESNIASNRLYIKMMNEGKGARTMNELLSKADQLNELIMTSIRTRAGLDLNVVETRFGRQSRTDLEAQLPEFIARGWAGVSGSRLSLSTEGLKFCNLISAELFKLN